MSAVNLASDYRSESATSSHGCGDCRQSQTLATLSRIAHIVVNRADRDRAVVNCRADAAD